MGTPISQRGAIVEDAVRGISHIATLPEVTLRIIGLVEDPTSTAQDLHNVIANDPALCSRILKVVNSAFYGLPRQIGSINRAIVLLGLNAVKNIAIAASLNKLFRAGELSATFSARDLWIHSIATAAGAKLLSDELSYGMPDEAFLAGLIHDIGIVVEMQVHRGPFIEVLAEVGAGTDVDMREIERRVFGADHGDFGAGLCDLWRFPAVFVEVTGHHHDPMQLDEQRRLLPSLVYVADRLAASHGYGFSADLTSFDIAPEVLETLGITREQLERIHAAIPETYAEVESTFG